jgi:predicted TIM-barrel fold metal-dependent hydrolase
MSTRLLALLVLLVSCAGSSSPTPAPARPTSSSTSPADAQKQVRAEADRWRAEHRIVDMHVHVERAPERFAQAAEILDAVGIGVAINLSGGTVTPKPPASSALETAVELSLRHPGRFLQYMNLDYTHWDDDDFATQAVRQVERGASLGAAGFKEYKRLGLNLRDKSGALLKVDDPKLDPMWKRLGELGMPVSIHVADPRAFWQPFDPSNERWEELHDHKDWWFGDATKYPKREELLAALSRVVKKHPGTTFVCVHFANNAEDLDWVDRELDAHPNMMADLAARIPEIGRHDPDKVRRLFEKHQDRILFGTDFQVYETLTLGSGGDGPPPTPRDAAVFFAKHWQWLETRDRDFPHMTPIQGKWTISAIGLSSSVLKKIYFENAEKLLARPLERLRRR